MNGYRDQDRRDCDQVRWQWRVCWSDIALEGMSRKGDRAGEPGNQGDPARHESRCRMQDPRQEEVFAARLGESTGQATVADGPADRDGSAHDPCGQYAPG